jgi:Mlc titration factor MtfA (ptsG expression regulator)
MIGRWWREHRKTRLLRERAIPDELWLATLRSYPFLARRPLADLLKLRELATLFLAEKEFTPVGGLVLTDAIALAVAAQACVPILALGLDWYDDMVGIVLQPDEVVAQRQWTDDDGVVHEGEEILSGEAMPGGPVMLSWRDVAEAGESALDGYNVVIHEFVHVIDLRDGVADGVPPLPDRAARERWLAVMQREHAALCAAVEAEQPTWLDPYAASGLEEFFAVTAETFFVAPHDLHEGHPAVYELLREFFQQDPRRFVGRQRSQP